MPASSSWACNRGGSRSLLAACCFSRSSPIRLRSADAPRAPATPSHRSPPSTGSSPSGASNPGLDSAAYADTSHAHLTPAFSVTGAKKSYGALIGARRGVIHGRQGRGSLPSRRQRRRQEHAGQDHFRRNQARRGLDDAGGEIRPFSEPQDARAAGLETVYQDLALCSNLSVTHNMMLGREHTRRWLGFIPVRDDQRAAAECRAKLATLGVTLGDNSILVRSLSGGQRQSVAIARSLAEQVKLICLDEPTASLGVKQTAQVTRLIRSIAASGTGVILVTHDLSTVRALADRIVVLSLGRVVYDGSAKTYFW